MIERIRFKQILGELDPNTRSALLYLEKQIAEKHIETLRNISEINTQPVNLDDIHSELKSIEQRYINISNKINDLMEECKASIVTVAEINDITEKLDKTLSMHVNIINDATVHVTTLLSRTYDLLAFAYYKDQNIGVISGQVPCSPSILKGENKVTPEECGIIPVEDLIKSLEALKKSIQALPIKIKNPRPFSKKEVSDD